MRLPFRPRRTKFCPMDRSASGPTAALRIAEDIVPIGELKAHLSEKIRALRGRRRPLVVTQNGKAAGVLLSPRAFDQLVERARLVAAVEEGLADVKAGRVVDHQEVVKEVRSRFGSRKR